MNNLVKKDNQILACLVLIYLKIKIFLKLFILPFFFLNFLYLIFFKNRFNVNRSDLHK